MFRFEAFTEYVSGGICLMYAFYNYNSDFILFKQHDARNSEECLIFRKGVRMNNLKELYENQHRINYNYKPKIVKLLNDYFDLHPEELL